MKTGLPPELLDFMKKQEDEGGVYREKKRKQKEDSQKSHKGWSFKHRRENRLKKNRASRRRNQQER